MNQVILEIRNNRLYLSTQSLSSSGHLYILGRFMENDVRNQYGDMEIRNAFINNLIEENLLGFSFCEITKKGKNIRLFSEYLSDEDTLLIPVNILVDIIKKWWKLIDDGYKKIIITEHEDGTFSLEGRNLEPEKPKSTFSKFLDFILCRKN